MAFIFLSSHDMYLKMDTFFVEPDQNITLYLFNGTFGKSENVITRNRMKDVSHIIAGKTTHPSESSWTEKDNQTLLKINSGQAGTSMVGLSTKPNSIKLSAKDFAEYLVHDGIKDMYEARKKSGEDSKEATEKYSKHVKAVFQVGDKLTDDYKKKIGYPIEFIPMSNPYSAKVGEKLSFQLLKNGKPLANESVYGSYVGFHHHAADGSHSLALETRTDKNGVVTLNASKGKWYLRTINMVKTKEKGFDYESNWATITFEIK
jgi:hypothetical protein